MQLEFFEVPSPCVGVCQSNEKGFCLGCMRTREERNHWQNFNTDEKQKVIKRCMQRQKRKNAPEKIKIVQLEEENPQPSLLDPPKANKSTLENDIDFGDFEL